MDVMSTLAPCSLLFWEVKTEAVKQNKGDIFFFLTRKCYSSPLKFHSFEVFYLKSSSWHK